MVHEAKAQPAVNVVESSGLPSPGFTRFPVKRYKIKLLLGAQCLVSTIRVTIKHVSRLHYIITRLDKKQFSTIQQVSIVDWETRRRRFHVRARSSSLFNRRNKVNSYVRELSAQGQRPAHNTQTCQRTSKQKY